VKNFCCAFDLFSHRYNNAHTHTHASADECASNWESNWDYSTRRRRPILYCISLISIYSLLRFFGFCFSHTNGGISPPIHKQTHTHTHRGTRGGRLLRATGLLPLCTLTSQQSRILIFVYFAFFFAPILLCCTLSLAQRTTYYCCFCLSCCCCCLASSSSLIFVAVMALLPTFFALFRGFSTFPRTLL